MNRLYNVTIYYLGKKKRLALTGSTICLTKDGGFLAMDAEGAKVLFSAKRCEVEEIAACAIIITGFTDNPEYITAYCVYSGSLKNS